MGWRDARAVAVVTRARPCGRVRVRVARVVGFGSWGDRLRLRGWGGGGAVPRLPRVGEPFRFFFGVETTARRGDSVERTACEGGWLAGWVLWVGGVGSVSGAAARDPRGAREKSTGNGRKRAFFCVASVLCRPSPACVAGAAVGRNTARFLEGRFVAAASSETREFVKLLVRERANNRVEPSRLAGMRKRRAGYYLKRIKGCLERLNNFFSGQDLDLIDFSATLI